METHFPSPSGKYVFQIVPWEARMSLWVETPRLVQVASYNVLFDLTSSQWSLDTAQWQSEEQVQLWMRRYPGDHQPGSFLLIIECDARWARLEGVGVVALSDLEQALEGLYARCRVSS